MKLDLIDANLYFELNITQDFKPRRMTSGLIHVHIYLDLCSVIQNYYFVILINMTFLFDKKLK